MKRLTAAEIRQVAGTEVERLICHFGAVNLRRLSLAIRRLAREELQLHPPSRRRRRRKEVNRGADRD